MVVRLQSEVASLKGKLEVSEVVPLIKMPLIIQFLHCMINYLLLDVKAKVARLTRLKKEGAAALTQEVAIFLVR